MSYDAISATNLANYIPSIWAKDVLAAVENSLILGALVDRSYESYAVGGGNTIVVPNLANLTAATVNTAVDVTWYDAIQNVTNISLNLKFDVAVMVDDINQLQTNPKYFEKVRSKLAYALAKQIDTNTAGLIPGLGGQYGTVNTAISETTIIDAYEYLNDANAPFEGRAWVVDPGSISDLLRTDYFIRMDYVPGSVVSQGFQGRQILGSPVYISTNLPAYAGGPHAAAYFQKEAIALVLQMAPRFEVARFPARHADGIIGLCVLGVQEMRDTFGCCINTRS